ncbi:MAG: lactate utilization protein [Candidatus Hydrogenedentes bacterium]|nr:lactate utilization protein [Candidatus Hydrogenedentota bacterium]
MASNVVTRFMEKHAALSGKPHRVRSSAEAADAIADILAAIGAQRVALANLSQELSAAIERTLSGKVLELRKEPFPASTLPHAIDDCQAGITGMAFGIAQTATLAEIAVNDAQRLVSALPRTHIGIVHAKDVVETLEDAAPLLRSIFQQNPSNCTVSFISGPSRTGDIELKLTLGVHGPGEQHAIIIEE